MKGQMFIIASLIIAISLVILVSTARAPEITQRRTTLEITLETKNFENIEKEFKNVPRFSANQKENISLNVYDFLNFTKIKTNEKFFDFYSLFVGSLANTSGILNISTINLLNQSKDVTLNLNGTTKNQIVQVDGIWNTNFTISPGSSYVLRVSFEGYSENITIKTKSNKDVYVGFFDIYLESSESMHRKKFQERYILN